MRCGSSEASATATLSTPKATSASCANQSRKSVLVLDDEVGAADGAGQLRLLTGELELVRQLGRNFHPVGELEPDRPLALVVDGVQHIDRQTALVEDVGPADALDVELGRLERLGRYDDVALFLEDLVHVRDELLGLARRLDGEVEVVLVLEVAGLVRPQAGKRVGDRRRLQTDGRDVLEIDGVGHGGQPTRAQRQANTGCSYSHTRSSTPSSATRRNCSSTAPVGAWMRSPPTGLCTTGRSDSS